jgi:hypothetical protein
LVYALVSAFIFLSIYKKLSNQEKIVQHKKKIFGYILQIRLYQDKPIIIIYSIAKILQHNLLYIKYTLSSLLVIIIPLLIITAQINNRSGYAPLRPNQQFTIKAWLNEIMPPAEGEANLYTVFCETSADIILETSPLRISENNCIQWRARINTKSENGERYIKIAFKEKNDFFKKKVMTTYDRNGFSPSLEQLNIKTALTSSAEGFLSKESPISRISINYSRAAYNFLFWEVDALVLYFILTLLFAYFLKSLFKVAI